LTPSATDPERLRELDEDTREAWSTYRGRLVDLTGDEYERVEDESWSELQSELARLERRREQLRSVV